MAESKSVRGLRRKIFRLQQNGRRVPDDLKYALERALEKKPESQATSFTRGIPSNFITPPKKKPKTYEHAKILPGQTFGKASKGRILTNEELERRKQELLSGPV